MKLITEAIKTTPVDFMVVYGFRGKIEQDKAVAEGKSKRRWPSSKHNKSPSLAVDLAPFKEGKLVWKSEALFKTLAEHILATAKSLEIPIRWGGDWNSNGSSSDEKFIDMPHFELITK